MPDMAQLFADVAIGLSQQFGGPYFPGSIVTRLPAVEDAGGAIITPGAVDRRACMVQVDAVTEAMRLSSGYADKDMRILVLVAGVTGVIDTDNTIDVLKGPSAGSWQIASVARDPMNSYWECRGRWIAGVVDRPSGRIDATSTASGRLGARKSISGAVSAVSAVTGILTVPGRTFGVCSAQATVSGTLRARASFAGAASAQSTAVGTVRARARVSGVASAIGTSFAALRARARLAGASSAQGSASGTLTGSDVPDLNTYWIADEVSFDPSSGSYTFMMMRDGSSPSADKAWSVGASSFPFYSAASAADFGGAFPSGSVHFNDGETEATFTVTPTTAAMPE